MWLSEPVRNDAESDNLQQRGFVSLSSENVQIVAKVVRIKDATKIGRIGWVNIIQRSSRTYHYSDMNNVERLRVTDEVTEVPAWDGEKGNTAPYYFGGFYSRLKEDEKSRIDDVQVGKEFMFNDAPCLAPSIPEGKVDSDNRMVGVFTVESKNDGKLYVRKITGQDVYLACLVVQTPDSNNGKLEVAWAVPWSVTFNATVEVSGNGDPLPVVIVGDDAVTELNLQPAIGKSEAEELVNSIKGKRSSAESKKYQAEWL